MALDGHASESFQTPTHWRGRHRADSVRRFDLARTSTLRYLEYSASRQSSLPINHDYQQTATNYLLYQSRAYTEHQIFFFVSQAPQTIYESPTARAVHDTSCVVWGRPECIKQSRCTRRTRNCCCPDPALAARKKNNYSGIST